MHNKHATGHRPESINLYKVEQKEANWVQSKRETIGIAHLSYTKNSRRKLTLLLSSLFNENANVTVHIQVSK